MELPCMLPKSSFHSDHINVKCPIVLEHAYIPQDAKYGLFSLHEGEFNSIISKSPMDVGRRNLFQMDIPTAAPLVVYKPYPILSKYEKLIDKKIKLLENTGCYVQKLKSVGHFSYHSTKNARPLSPHKQQLHLVLDYRSLNKSINTAHNYSSVISYYPYLTLWTSW